MLVGADGRLLSPEGVGGEGIEEGREEGVGCIDIH